MSRTIYRITVTLACILLSSCNMNPTVTVTIHNTTRITSGTLHLIYGNYENEYADAEEYLWDVSFPCVVTIRNATPCANYTVIAQLDDPSEGSSAGMVLLDTRIGTNIEGAIDFMLDVINETITDDYEPDNDFASASLIQYGEYEARSLDNASDTDYVSFYAYTDLYYVIETENDSGNPTNLAIYDPSHIQLDYDAGSGYNGGSKISWTSTYTGVCYINVDNSSGSTSYGLSLSSYLFGNALLKAREKLYEWSSR
jgi:hypothetical protein